MFLKALSELNIKLLTLVLSSNNEKHISESFATQRDFLTTMVIYDQAKLLPLIINLDLERVNTTLKANRWQNNKDIILACVALKQKCSTGVGKWLRENCHNIDDRQKAQITEKCK